MTHDSEKALEKLLNQKIKERGGLSLKLLTAFFAGLPDRLCLLPGARLYFIEMKSTGDKPGKLQKIVHRKLAALGFEVHVLDTFEKLNNFIETRL